jgi:hypothetical protein
MASTENADFQTFEAGADISASQFRFMAYASDGQIDPVGTAGAAAVGVLYNLPAAAGRAAQVAVRGKVKVVAGAAITRGAKVSSDNVGRAITAVSTHHVLGTALQAAGAAGEVIEVELGSPSILA